MEHNELLSIIEGMLFLSGDEGLNKSHQFYN